MFGEYSSTVGDLSVTISVNWTDGWKQLKLSLLFTTYQLEKIFSLTCSLGCLIQIEFIINVSPQNIIAS